MSTQNDDFRLQMRVDDEMPGYSFPLEAYGLFRCGICGGIHEIDTICPKAPRKAMCTPVERKRKG
jgi:hypothetical protein